MKNFILSSWSFVMDNRYNPLRHLDMASQHYLMHVLGWMWSMVFSVSFLSIFHFQILWLAHLLVIAAIFTTVIIFKSAEEQQFKKLTPLKLSRGSTCVWQMDREA